MVLQTFQNIRCSRVFKNINTGRCFDVGGKIFEEPDGARYSSGDSSTTITFPYIPTTQVIKVEKQKED